LRHRRRTVPIDDELLVGHDQQEREREGDEEPALLHA
jgi:hypothetical protein